MSSKDVIAAFIAALAVVAIIATIVIAVVIVGDHKRAELRNCISTERSPLECRVAVYGKT